MTNGKLLVLIGVIELFNKTKIINGFIQII